MTDRPDLAALLPPIEAVDALPAEALPGVIAHLAALQARAAAGAHGARSGNCRSDPHGGGPLRGERDLETLRQKLLGLLLLRTWREAFTGDLGRAFAAIVALADRGEQVNVAAVLREAGGRVDASYSAWIATAYQSEASLGALVDSAACALLAAARDPGADVHRAIATAVGALRPAGEEAA